MRYSALLISAAFLVVIPTAVFAQNAGVAAPVFRPYGTPPVGVGTNASQAGTIHQTIQDARQNFKDQMAAAKQQFMQNLQLIKDARKQQIVSTINDKIPQINTRQTDRMKKTLDELTNILSRISSKEAELKTAGKDTSAVDTAIAAAQTAISNATTAVNVQAAKQYTITITSEQTLKTTIGPTIVQLRQDLITTQTTVKNARLAVIKAYQALMAANGVAVSPTVNPLTGVNPSTTVVTVTPVPTQ